MKIYLAGPMRGIPEFNFPAFHAAAKALREQGHEVFNPAEEDNKHHGTDVSAGNVDGCEQQAACQHGLTIRDALGRDMRYICGEAEAIALLPGWEGSSGANAEHATAKALGLKVIKLPGKAPRRAIPTEYVAKVDAAMAIVREELLDARAKYGSFRSTHEGMGVIEEEWQELWDEVIANNTVAASKEAKQVAAMALSFLVDLCDLELIPR